MKKQIMMGTKKKNRLRFILLIITILLAAGIVIDFLFDFVVLNKIRSLAETVWYKFLIKTVPIWVLIVIFILGFYIRSIIQLIFSGESSRSKNKRKKAFDYEQFLMSNKQTDIDGLLVKWNYKGDYAGGFSIDSVAPYCSRCDCRIVRNQCPNCGRDYTTHISRVFKDTEELKNNLYGHVKQKLNRARTKFKTMK